MTPTRWEYRKIVRTSMGWEKFLHELNQLGAAGWELVNFTIVGNRIGDELSGILKRPVEGELAPDPTAEEEERAATPGGHVA
jgi:hypothetical protein